MNRRISTCAFAVVVATAALAGAVDATAQVPTPKGTPVAVPVLLPSAAPQSQTPVIPFVPPPDRFALPDQAAPPSPQKPAQVTPAIQPPSPPQKPEPSRREEQRYGSYWLAGTTTNVRFEATISDQLGSGTPVKKTISVTIAEGGSASVRAGVTVPLPATTYVPQPQKEGGSTTPYSSFSYRDMGLSLDVRNVFVDGNFVRAQWSVEYNPVDEKVADSSVSSSILPAPPSFASFKQNLVLALESGKPLVVSQSSDPVPTRDRRMTLEVKATILK